MPDRLKTSARKSELSAEENFCIISDKKTWHLKHAMPPSLNCGHEMLSLSPIHGNSEPVHPVPSWPSVYFLLNQNVIYWKASCIKTQQQSASFSSKHHWEINMKTQRNIRYSSKQLGNRKVRKWLKKLQPSGHLLENNFIHNLFFFCPSFFDIIKYC